MTEAHEAKLRQKLIEIDTKLLSILTGDEFLDDENFAKIGRYESARNAVWRLLLAEEAKNTK